MKNNFGETKEKIMSATKEYAGKYYRAVGAVIVVALLCIISAVTLESRINKSPQSVGIVLSLSDVSSGKEAFAGNTFSEKGITYVEMQNVTYETEELAQLEKTEKQVDDILAARSQDKKDQAALAAFTATQSETIVSNVYDPNYVGETQQAQTVTAASTYTPITEITYADADGSYSYIGEFTLTGYCPCAICCGKWSNPSNPITSSGVTAVAGRTIAAYTSRYPFGTKLMINGQIYTVEDVGGAIKGNHIDIFFNTHEEALAFGKQYSSVYFVQ